MYIGWYGLGRFFIEGLRVDSLVIGNMRISQMVAGICVVLSVILLIVIGGRVRRMGEDYQLYCNTEACKVMMTEIDAKRNADKKQQTETETKQTEPEDTDTLSMSKEKAEQPAKASSADSDSNNE